MRLRKGTVALLFVLLAGLFVWTFEEEPAPHIQGDGYYTLLWAASLALDHDLDLTNQYRQCGDPWQMTERRPPSEHRLWPHNTWSLGPSLVWAPMLAAAKIANPTPESEDPRWRFGCVGPWAEFALYGTVLMGLLAVFLTYRLARRHVGDVPALVGAFGIALATPLAFYTAMVPSYSHVPAAFGAALFLERWDATRGSRSVVRWIVLGVLLGIAMLMRAQSGILALAPLFEWLASAREDVRERAFRRLAFAVATGILFVAFAALAFFPQLYVWKHTYGTWFAVPQGPLYMRWGHPHLDGVLFGAASGLLTWSPILYAGLAGFLVGIFDYRTRRLSLTFAAVFAGYWYVNACVWDWWGSAGFGARRFTEALPMLGVGIAFFVWRFERWAERRRERMVGLVLASAFVAFAVSGYGSMWGVAAGEVPNTRDERASFFWAAASSGTAKGTHDLVGNPLAWPASIPFAIEHGVHPRRYDMVRGIGGFYQEFETGRIRARLDFDHARIGRGAFFDYAVDGFEEEPRVVSGRPSAVTAGTHARVLLPLFADDLSEVELNWTATTPKDAPAAAPTDRGPARVAITWNGQPLAQHDVPNRWSKTRIVMPPRLVRVGVNEVELEIVDGPVAIESFRYYQAELPDDPRRMRDYYDLLEGPPEVAAPAAPEAARAPRPTPAAVRPTPAALPVPRAPAPRHAVPGVTGSRGSSEAPKPEEPLAASPDRPSR